MPKTKKPTFIVYQSTKETLITTPQTEEAFIKQFFFKGSGRELDDYDRHVKFDDALEISVSVHAS